MVLNAALVEYRGRARSVYRPIMAVGTTPGGEEVELYVKGLQPAFDDLTGIRLFAEWCGYKLLEYLRVQVPRHGIVEITQEFLDAARGDLDDVRPGPAFASEAVDGGVPAEFFSGRAASIVNREHMSGAVVSDVVAYNVDRHAGNVLVSPEAAGSKRRLWFIDNGWTVAGKDGPMLEINATSSCIPVPSKLRELVPDEASFMGYLLEAEGLSADLLEVQFQGAPSDAWLAVRDLPQRAAAAFVRRGQQARSVIIAEMLNFPNACT